MQYIIRLVMANSPTVRAPRREEIVRAAEIGQIAFETPAPEGWIRSYKWIAENRGLECMIVVEADGELVASMVCSPGQVRFGEDIVSFSAVGGVATLPEHRRNGYAGMMMEEAVRILHRNGHHTSALWPFSFNYYRKFGWEVGSENRVYKVPASVAAELAEPDGVRPACEKDIPAISSLIDRFAVRYNGVTVRDELWWGCIFADNGFTFDDNDDPKTSKCPWVHETDGEIDACAFFERWVGGEEEYSFEIKELVSDTPQARNAILSRLGRSEVSFIRFYAPIDDGFLQELPNPRLINTEIQAGYQFRVVNPSAALAARSTDPELRGRLAFTVVDPVLPVVDFVAEVEDGKIRTSRGDAGEHLSMTVQTFSQLYCGYMRPSRAMELGKLEASSHAAVEFAERLFPRGVPYRSQIELG